VSLASSISIKISDKVPAWAEGTYPWKSAHVIATLVVGGITLIVFAFYEVYMPLKQPLLPVRLFKIRNLVACVFVGSVGQMVSPSTCQESKQLIPLRIPMQAANITDI